jgi:hypothetical protein
MNRRFQPHELSPNRVGARQKQWLRPAGGSASKCSTPHGHARYDEKTSRFLADTSTLLLEKYGGDLRELRETAKRDPTRKRELLRECKGIGNVGVDIFFREAQVIWDELYPFADQRALRAARKLGLPAR